MHIMKSRPWNISENLATPEHIFLNRRTFMAGVGAGALLLVPPPHRPPVLRQVQFLHLLPLLPPIGYNRVGGCEQLYEI